jgi:hypothetical protein
VLRAAIGGPSERNRIGQKPIEPNLLLTLHHNAADCHHERHGCIDLLIQPALLRIQFASPVCLAAHVANAPRQYQVPVMVQPAGPHWASNPIMAGLGLCVVAPG